MDAEYILLKAQFEALRNYFTSLLSTIFKDDENTTDKVWRAKYLLWSFERDNLYASCCNTQPSSPESEKINHRCFQLQVLMDVAYIQGQLEGYDLIRYISPDAYNLAQSVFLRSDGSEEKMLPLIDEIS